MINFSIDNVFWQNFNNVYRSAGREKQKKDRRLPILFVSLLSDSNQRPRDYKSRALAN